MRPPDGYGLGLVKFAEATQEFLLVADEYDPGDAPSAELIGDYGKRVAQHFGVTDLHDLEATSTILGSLRSAGDLSPVQLAVCALLIGYVAGTKPDA